jgi:hypothetical protein
LKHNGDERNGDISDHILLTNEVSEASLLSTKILVDAFVLTELKLAEEASVIVFFDDQKEIIDSIDFRERVCVPKT